MAGPLLLKVAVGGLAVAAGAALTFVLVDPSDATPPPMAQAWVDHPFDGSSLPDQGSVAIIVHATDPDGVAQVAVSIDDETIDTQDLAGDAELVTIETTWEPPGPGTYELEVVGEDGDGEAGRPGIATFTVGDPPAGDESTTTTQPAATSTTEGTDPDATTTTAAAGPADPTTTTEGSTQTTAPRVTTTTRPTSTTVAPCRPDTPRLVNPPNGQDVTTRTPRLTWDHSGCRPDRFTVQVADNLGFVADRGSYVHRVDVPGLARNITWEPLRCDTTYYWRVRAVAPGGMSAWSRVRSIDLVC
jgi:Bacterial Ig domain